MVDRKVDMQGDLPRALLWKACTQGLLSVNMQALWCGCIRYGLTCLVATTIARASTLHGNHVNCEPCGLVLKTLPSITCCYGWRTVWHLFRVCKSSVCYNPQLITQDGKRDGVSSRKGCLGLVEWCAERLSIHWIFSSDSWPVTVSSSFVHKECRASWDDTGEHIESPNEWFIRVDSGAQG